MTLHTMTPIETGLILLAFMGLAILVALTLLGPAFDVSRNVANLSPEQQVDAQRLLESLAKAIDEERYADAERISSELDALNQKMLEGLDNVQSKIICAWCNTVMGDSDTPEDTHSICQQCKDGLLEAWEEAE